MKNVICILLLSISSFAHAERYCIYNGSIQKSCLDSLAQCKKMLNQNFARNEECRKENTKHQFPETLGPNNPKALCLWTQEKGKMKNLGCMESVFCERAKRQYDGTVCIKGNFAGDLVAVKKIYDEEVRKTKQQEEIIANKQLEKEKEIETKGSSKELVDLIRKKHGDLKLVSKADVAKAQSLLEPLCKENDASACFVLSELHANSDFKSQWNLKPVEECSDLKKSYEYCNKSCVLGWKDACEEIGHKSSTFIRSPGDDENVGIECEMPAVSSDVETMKESCSKLKTSSLELSSCIYKRLFSLPTEKLTYEQSISEGELAEAHGKTDEAKSFFQKACNIKKESYGCVMYAYILFPSDNNLAKKNYESSCLKPKLTDENIKRMCEAFYDQFLRSAHSGDLGE